MPNATNCHSGAVRELLGAGVVQFRTMRKIAISCNAKGDDPATDDDIPYTEVKYTTVEAGGTATVDFSLVPQAENEPVESE